MAICLLASIAVVLYIIGSAIASSTRDRHRDRGEDLRESGLVALIVACLFWLFH